MAAKRKAPTRKANVPAAPVERNWAGKEIVRVTTQAALDAALSRDVEIWLCGTGRFVLRTHRPSETPVVAWESSHVEARGSSHVVARESSHVVARGSSHVEAWESSHVEARGSSHVVARGSSHVEAWESSHVEARGSSYVVARGSSHVEAWGSSDVEAGGAASLTLFDCANAKASRQVVIQRHSTLAVVDGGIVVDIQPPRTAAEWCDWHGVTVVDGVATVYKGLNADFKSPHGTSYAPDSIPEAPDWDGGKAECGGGLHFSPTAAATRNYHASAVKFVACQVRLSDMRAPQPGDAMDKVKAKGCCGPCVEVDLSSRPVDQKASAA